VLPEKRVPSHPGEILLLEFLNPLKVTQVEFANHLQIPIQRVNEIIRGKRGVTPETAWLFAGALGTSPEFWLNLQAAHDLAKTQPKRLAPIADLRVRLQNSAAATVVRHGVRTGAARRASKSRA
jgi:addiction module HigA family antidote